MISADPCNGQLPIRLAIIGLAEVVERVCEMTKFLTHLRPASNQPRQPRFFSVGS